MRRTILPSVFLFSPFFLVIVYISCVVSFSELFDDSKIFSHFSSSPVCSFFIFQSSKTLANEKFLLSFQSSFIRDCLIWSACPVKVSENIYSWSQAANNFQQDKVEISLSFSQHSRVKNIIRGKRRKKFSQWTRKKITAKKERVTVKLNLEKI